MGSFVPVVAPLQIIKIGLAVDWAGSRQTRLLCWRDLNLNLLSNGLSHFPLQVQNVAQVALIAAGPQMLLGRGMNEPDGNAHSISGTEDGTLDNSIHLEFPSDLRKLLGGFLVVHGGRPGDHTQSTDFSQMIDQRFGHSFRKIVLLEIS